MFPAKLCHGKGGLQACAAGARYATLFISPCCMLPFPSTFDQSSPARWYLKKFPKTPGQPGTHRPIDPGTRVDRTMERWLGWGLRVKKIPKKKKKRTEKVGHLFRSTELGPWFLPVQPCHVPKGTLFRTRVLLYFKSTLPWVIWAPLYPPFHFPHVLKEVGGVGSVFFGATKLDADIIPLLLVFVVRRGNGVERKGEERKNAGGGGES